MAVADGRNGEYAEPEDICRSGTLKKLIIALVAVIAVVVGGLAALPLFLPVETIRTELAARIQAASGRATRIDGPVSFSVIPTARLTAEGIGIAGISSDAEAFSVESVSFGLSLLPLITGDIEIYGVTISRPSITIETDANGATNWSTSASGGDATAASIEAMIAAGQEEGAASDTLAALDRLSIGRVTISDGTLVWRDLESRREERIEAFNVDIRVPKLDGASTLEGSFVQRGVTHALALEIGERPNPTRFESIPVALTLSSDAGNIKATGIALDGDALFSGKVETEGESLAGFALGFGVELPDLPVFGKFQTTSTVDASASQIRIAQYSVDLNGLRARGGVVVGLDRTRPGIGLKIEAEQVDTALFVGQPNSGRSDGGVPSNAAADDTLDFSALGLIDANIDFSAKETLIGSVPIANLGLDIQLVDGRLSTNIRSATINGAPGSGAIAIDASGAVPAIRGNIKINGLDAPGLVALSGVDMPVDAGTVGLDVTFAASGATQGALLGNLEGSGRVSLVNGKITELQIADLVGGDAAANEIDDVDVMAEFSSLGTPVSAKGGFNWRGERFSVTARGDPRALAAGRTTPVAINATSQRAYFGFTGDASLSGLGNGTVNLSTPSLRDLLAWIGQPLTPGGGLGPFSIKGAVSLSDKSFSFERADFTLDGSSGVGTGTMSFGGIPKVSAGLAMKKLDITPYLVASGASSGAGGASGQSGGTGAGWSGERISFAGLRAIDANLNFKTDEIIADKIKIGPSNLTVAISGGKLSAELTEMALYAGIGVGTLSVDGSSATPSLAAFFRLDNIDALPFLRDAANFSRIEGTASVSFDLRSTGDSEAALMAGLEGKGAMDFRNGAIRGIDIPKMVRTLSVETLLGWQQGSDEKTDFSQLSGTYTIARGIVTNDDLVLVGPLLRVTGAGTADIPKRTLSYRVDPKIVASLEGQGGSKDLEGFAVPIRVDGSWDRPRIYPEIEGILQDPQKALDQLRKLGGGLFGGTNGDQPQTDNGTGKSVEDKINEEVTKGLDRLFGGSGGKPPVPPAQPPPAASAPSPDNQAPLDLTPQAGQTGINPPAETEAGDSPQKGTDQADAPQADTPTDPAVDLLKSLFGQ